MEIYNGTYCVYVHINKINGKKYVGQTIHGDDPKKRWKNGTGYKTQKYFWRAIVKYGWYNFDHEIVASNLTKEEADNFEKLLIDKLNTKNNQFGYNLTSGGEGLSGYCMSDESIQKRKNTMKKYFSNPEYIQKMRDVASKRSIYQFSIDGTFVTKYESAMEAERKLNINNATISKCAFGKVAVVDGYIFLFEDNLDTLSQRIEKCKTYTKLRREHIVQLSADGVYIAEWKSSYDAGQKLNIQYKNINAVCKGKRTKAGGFKWMYLSDYLMLHEHAC